MNEKRYPYTIFIVKEEYVNDVPSVIEYEDEPIYAYSDNKEIAELFESTRNMEIFIKKKKNLSVKEIHELCKIHTKQYLKIRKLTTKSPNYKKVEVPMAITTSEELVFDAHTLKISYDIWCHTNLVQPKIFTRPIRELLNKIKYDYIYHTGMSDKNKSDILDDIDPLDFKHANMSLDELSIFLNIFKTTM